MSSSKKIDKKKTPKVVVKKVAARAETTVTAVKNKSASGTQYWLMKTEPDVFSIDDLIKKNTTLWEGVRNYQARNLLRDMQTGDAVLFYHSSTDPSGVAGIAVVCKTAVADPTQFDKKSEYYDAKATKEKPIWFCPEVKFVTKFNNFISLNDLKNDKNLTSMLVIRKGQRLSVQPITPEEFEHIHQLGIQ